ncbi:hypothetical protein X560_0373 [Listeria fleischmannii 1991]|uniref:Uncharacterized protein n=2 Tax=Listeria fleischmannii TaxID=1069827 RepID=A0A2X3H7U4_9LIST|nr:hypothetical protein [Listeria fleischmannii]KMT60953.1 hypothetical protein X560_0373 [Listeria fleischmannii 1991]SQC70606.1 Uncharacterised protein [Listeria fleischmannii subsp. fleischmannii]
MSQEHIPLRQVKEDEFEEVATRISVSQVYGLKEFILHVLREEEQKKGEDAK